MPNVIGFIPARGGSKGIPQKNIHLLNGKPLLCYTVESALNSGVCDEVTVSTEDELVSEVALKSGATVDARPVELAQDNSTIDSVLEEFINRRELAAEDIIVILQPTSPLRNKNHISEGLKWYSENTCQKRKAEVLMSVSKTDSQILYAYCEEGEFMKPVCDWVNDIHHRQFLPNVYLPNRAMYIFSVAAFLEHNHLPKNHIVPFVMSAQESVDIDTEEDIRQCSYYLMGMPERRA